MESKPAPSKVARDCDPQRHQAADSDRELFDRLVGQFVPPNAFDAHAHWYDLRLLDPRSPVDAFAGPPEVGHDAFVQSQSGWMGDRCPSEGLFFPFPEAALDVPAANRFLVDELQRHPDSRGLLMIRPTDDPAQVEHQLRQESLVGLKVYHVFAGKTDTLNLEAGQFLPDWAWEIADRLGLCIMLHLVLGRALADERNQRYLRAHCLRYTAAKVILAHAARGFSGRHTAEGIGALAGLDNVFFDTSAVCEAEALEAIIEAFGPTRLMYGSDFPACQWRGRSVSVGDGFYWLLADSIDWSAWPLGKPTLCGIESLLALKHACRRMHLSDADVERIFCTNARQVVGIEPAGSGRCGQAAYLQAKRLFPGGTQLLSKRPEMYAPNQWPPYYAEARGCEVIDLDGRRFVDFTSNGIGACLLGFAHRGVSEAVIRRIQMGSMCTLNNPEEIELARMLIAMHPWAENVRLARTGGESLAVAVRIARAATRRDAVAICGYHGWSDWYLAANLDADGALDGHLLPGLSPSGVPRRLRGTTLPFAYNKIDQLHKIVSERGGELAAVVMEPTRSVDPDDGFLEGVRQLCDDCGARLVFDEVTTGFRLYPGGAHMKYGIEPDVAVFAKAMGNGHPIAAVIGKAETMAAAQGSFISSTYWTEGVGPTAAVATLRAMGQVDVPRYVARVGCQLRDRCADLARTHRLPLAITGHPALMHLAFDHPRTEALTTLLTVRMLEHGFLAGSVFYPSLAHEDRHVDAYLTAADEVFGELAQAIENDDVEKRIGGPIKHVTFSRLT